MLILGGLNLHILLFSRIENGIFWNIVAHILNIILYYTTNSDIVLVTMICVILLLNVILACINNLRYTLENHEFEIIIMGLSMVVLLTINMILVINIEVNNICNTSVNKKLCMELLISSSRKLTDIDKICISDDCKNSIKSYLNIK